MYIVLDTSGSIGNEPYEVAKSFIADLVSGFTIGENNVWAGVVLFGVTGYLIFDLNNSYDSHYSWARHKKAV